MKERRKHKRIAIKVPVKWRSESGAEQNLADAFLFDIQNITRRGLFLKTALRLPKGSRLDLELKLREDSKPIKLKGKAVWQATKSKHPYLYPGIGIEFEHISRKEHKELNEFLKYKFNNFRDAVRLKNMYLELKNMASRLVELEERHTSATHFRKIIDNAIKEIDDVAHILDREIDEIKKM